MIPHVVPPFWPERRVGRFAGSVYVNSTELLDAPGDAVSEVIGKCVVGLIGLADDEGVGLNGGRVGASEGPNAFRAALARYGSAIPMGAEGAGGAGGTGGARYPHVFDAGNVLPGKDIVETHERVSAAAGAVARLGLLPVGIGGGHDLTYALVRGVASVVGAMHGLYFDAHLDVREEVGSGMPFRRLVEEGHATGLSVVGLDEFSNSAEHFRWFTEHGGRAERFEVSAWPGSAEAARAERRFVSVDLDVLDAAHAPGVSAMNPAGMSVSELTGYARAAGRDAGVKCFDIMELNPLHDADGRTARVAARVFLEFLRGVGERTG